MIRAKAVSAKEVDSGNDIYGNPIKRIQYEIKQIKVTGGRCGVVPLGRAVRGSGAGVGVRPLEAGDPGEVSCLLRGRSKSLGFSLICKRLQSPVDTRFDWAVSEMRSLHFGGQ